LPGVGKPGVHERTGRRRVLHRTVSLQFVHALNCSASGRPIPSRFHHSSSRFIGTSALSPSRLRTDQNHPFPHGPVAIPVAIFGVPKQCRSPSYRHRAYAGGLPAVSPRVPYRKRYQQPCDGHSALATAPCEPGDELQGTWPREQLMRMFA